MNIELIEKDPPPTRFNDIESGEFFLYHNTVYIKINQLRLDGGHVVNAIVAKNGSAFGISYDEEVFRLDSEVKVWKKEFCDEN